MESVEHKAYGKVNLGLDVTGRRQDGYHLVKMIMQTVDVFDTVCVSKEEPSHSDAAVPYHIQISCDHPGVPQDSRNLAYRAAERLCRDYDLKADLYISIQKRIPVAAGMAGGSADAAAVICAMNQLFSLGMDQQKQDEIAVSLGADVPFCLRRGTYLSEGIGEKLTRVSDLAPCWMVIVKPDIQISTAWAYGELDRIMEASEERGGVLHPDIDLLIQALQNRNVVQTAQCMGNILELAAVPRYLVIQELKSELESYGAVKAIMSGSGPTVFGIFTDEKKAENAFLYLGGEKKYGKFKVEF